jgi:dienelactone hydrolase
MSWFDAVAGGFDTAMLQRGRLRGGTDTRIAAMSSEERLERLERLAARYAAADLLDLRSGAITPVRETGWLGTTLSWPSRLAPFHDDVTWPTDPADETAWATLFPCGRPNAPAVVVLHGYGGGNPWFDRALWPVRSWRRAGIDVVLATLPLHGRRSTRPTFTPPFPAQDPRLTHEGFRQAVHELGGLIAWLRAQGAPRVGAIGMSLGGYTTALLATLPALDLAFAGMVVPLASLAGFARRHGRLGDGAMAERLEAALERVYRPSSPFARAPAVASDRVVILAARGDRVTGVDQAERLAAHFGVTPRIGPGSHLVQRGLDWRALRDGLVRALG